MSAAFSPSQLIHTVFLWNMYSKYFTAFFYFFLNAHYYIIVNINIKYDNNYSTNLFRFNVVTDVPFQGLRHIGWQVFRVVVKVRNPAVNPIQFKEYTGRVSMVIEEFIRTAIFPESHVEIADLPSIRRLSVTASTDGCCTFFCFSGRVILCNEYIFLKEISYTLREYHIF